MMGEYWHLEGIISDCESKASEWVGPPAGQSKADAMERYAAELGVPAFVRESLTSLSNRVRTAAEAELRRLRDG
jgi:hypothetical protein